MDMSMLTLDTTQAFTSLNNFSFMFTNSVHMCSSAWHRVSEWLLLNTNSAILQLYHGKNKLICNEMMMSEVRFVLDQHA